MIKVKNLNDILSKEEFNKMWVETVYEADRPRTWKESEWLKYSIMILLHMWT